MVDNIQLFKDYQLINKTIKSVYLAKFANMPLADLAIYARQNFGIYDCPIGRHAEKLFAEGNYALYCSFMRDLIQNDSVKADLLRSEILIRLIVNYRT